MATEAQRKASRKWNKKNREKNALYTARSRAKFFIQNLADMNDIKELREMTNTREELLNNIDWFNQNVTEEIMKFDGTKNVIAITGQDLLTDDNIEIDGVEQDKSYILVDEDLYVIGTYDIERRFIKDFPYLSAKTKSELVERFAM